MKLKYTIIAIVTAASFVFAGEPGAVQYLQANLPPAMTLPQSDIQPQSTGYVPRTKSVSGHSQKDPKPFLKSLVLPGWGQYSQGRKNAAMQFLGTEALLWGGMYAFGNYGRLLRDDYKSFASSYAGIEPGGKDHIFFVDIGNYNSVNDYNQRQEIERDWESLYLDQSYYWQWDSDEHRNSYDDMRVKSDLYINSAVYFAGAIVVNHIWSAIDASRKSKPVDGLKAGVGFTPDGNSMLTIIKGF